MSHADSRLGRAFRGLADELITDLVGVAPVDQPGFLGRILGRQNSNGRGH
jgi:hypothetical protein